MLAWSEGTDNGRRKNQKSWLWRHCRRRAILLITWSPSKLVTLNPNSNQQAPDATSFFPAGWPTASSLAWKTSLRKVRTPWHCSRLRSVRFTYDDRGDIRAGQSTVAAISGLHCRALVMMSEHKADSPIAKFKEAGGTVREIDVWAESTRLSPPPVICIIVCLSWAVNHYRDNAITYKAQRDKNARELKPGERGNYWHADVRQRDVAALDAKYTKELAMLKPEWCFAWWCCRWSSCRLHIKAVCQSVREATITSPAWIMQPPPTGRHRWTGLFHPGGERLITMRKKQLEGTQKYINEQCRWASARWQIWRNYCEQYTRASSGV